MKQNLQIVGTTRIFAKEINGTTRIFAKEINGKTLYSTSISSKKQDGTYDKMYISVQLPKDMAVQNKTDITILEGFISFYKNKEGLAMPKIVVMKFEKEEAAEEEKSDLPF